MGSRQILLDNNPAIVTIAAIVRGADTNRHDLTPQSAGLLAISMGLRDLSPDDHGPDPPFHNLGCALRLGLTAKDGDPQLAAQYEARSRVTTRGDKGVGVAKKIMQKTKNGAGFPPHAAAPMSADGTKRTNCADLMTSATDPKQTNSWLANSLLYSDGIKRYGVGILVFMIGVITPFTGYLWHSRQSGRAVLLLGQVWQRSFFTAPKLDTKFCGLPCS